MDYYRLSKAGVLQQGEHWPKLAATGNGKQDAMEEYFIPHTPLRLWHNLFVPNHPGAIGLIQQADAVIVKMAKDSGQVTGQQKILKKLIL